MASVSIITVNFNQKEVTEALLNSIERLNTFKALEIIVVDNASKVNPIPEWKSKYPEIKFCRSEKNLGFAGGNNLGMKVAGGDYLFFINNDTEITAGLIETLASYLDQNPKVGMVSPKILYYSEPDVIQYVGFTPMNFITCRNKCIGQFEKDNGQYNNISGPTGFIHGAAMMVRREAIIKAGFMHENYFLYYEEMDWCERVRNTGYEIHVNTNVTIYHKESISVGAKSALKEYFMNRNRILFIRRNAGFMNTFLFYCYFLCIVTPRNILNYIKSGDSNFIGVLLKAIVWNFTHSKNSEDLGYKI